MKWKHLSISIVSVLLLLPFEQWVQACGGWIDPYDANASFFINDVANRPAYRPFYYTGYLHYYDQWDEVEETTTGQKPCTNIKEWQNYTGQDISLPDIDSFVYSYPYNELAALYDHIDKGKELNISKPARNNEFTRWFIKNKDKEALGYLMYAKQCEPHAAAVDGHYDNDTYKWIADKRDVQAMDKLRRNGLQLLAAAKNEEIKRRYVYQVIRLAFYAEDYPEALRLSDEFLKKEAPESIIYARSLALKAGALYRSGRRDEATYLYSRVFDMRDEHKEKTYLSFEWASDGKVDGALAFCRNEHEKAVLYVMRGLHIFSSEEEGGLKWMELARRSEPSVDGMDVLMTREINKLEESYFSGSNDPEQQSVNAVYLGKLNAFAKLMAEEPETGTRAFWLLASAYLYYMQGDLQMFRSYLERAGNEKMSDKEQGLHYVLSTLYTIRKNGKITADTEKDLLSQMEHIEKEAQNNERAKKTYRDILQAVIAKQYLAQGDSVKAAYAYDRAEREAFGGYSYGADYNWNDAGRLLESMNTQKLQEIQTWLDDRKAGAFDKWLTRETPYYSDRLKELEGTKYIRRHDFKSAVQVLRSIPKSEVPDIMPDAFVVHTDDYHEAYAEDSGRLYSKLSFAEAMLELQNRLDKNPGDTEAAFKYATGLYSMSYYGKAEEAYTYYRSSSDDDAYYQTESRTKMAEDDKDFYGLHSAEKYYQQAFEHSADKEMKARCLFMAAKCWQKRCPVPSTGTDSWFWGSGNDAYFVYSLQSPYFTQLVQDYKGTEYFNRAFSTCSYLRAYVERH